MKRLSFLLFLALLSTTFVFAQGYTARDMLNGRRVSDPQVSPDGQWVAFTVGDLSWDANRYFNQIYLVAVGGGTVRQLTRGASAASQPRWSPDGKRIAYVTGGQIWTMKPDGSDTIKITEISSGAGGPVWSPDGRWIAFGSDVYPDCLGDDACNTRKDAEEEANKVKAHTTERLLFRHWDHWTDVKRTHVFVAAAAKNSKAREITTGDWDSPPYGADTGANYAFSPDSKELAYLRNPDKVEATSTNSDIYVVPLAGGPARNITAANKGYEFSPMYTPDGKYIIYRSQAAATFEADRNRIMRYDRASGTSTELTTGFDLQADECLISPDGSKIYFTAGDRGHIPIFSVPTMGGKVTKIWNTVSASGLNNAAGGKLVFLNSSIAEPAEIVSASSDGTASGNQPFVKLTTVNQSANLPPAEELTWTGALNTKIHGFVVKPKNFDPNKKYPLLVIIHGGPQSAFYDSWGYRWNPQVFANAGYVVFLPNPRGSVGYGQKFLNDVSADWGGKAATDIRNGVVEVIKFPYVDKTRIGAGGASYGGYMVDWLMGHNTDPRFRFKAFLSHAGVYNLESMATATEELWFVNWEFKGYPWTNPAMYAKWSPHKFAKNFHTPTLVTAGELDYRVPYTESLQLYTTLQVKGIDSKLILFPDEGHWILKPQNSNYWYGQVINWFDKYLK